MHKLFFVAALVTLFSCSESPKKVTSANLDLLAEKYVRLGLSIGQHDEAFVDAYYGPDSLKPKGTMAAQFPKDSFLTQINNLLAELKTYEGGETNDILLRRSQWIQSQLVAFARRVKIFAGEYASFDVEAKELWGVQPPQYAEADFAALVKQLDSVLPGKGNAIDRFQALADKFTIPKDKIDTVFKTVIAECRARTIKHYPLPDNEKFSLEYVTGKSWSGYNWYKGAYTSLIQINTDVPIVIDRAIDVGSHESYPGHHVYNMLLEKNLYRDKGWKEISLYPLFSPQSLIAEGSANYGIDVVFPGDEKIRYVANVLLPLAGLDTAGNSQYFKALSLKGQLNYVRNEVARGIVNGTMTEAEGVTWLVKYGLYSKASAEKSIAFIKNYRSYVITYNYGMDLVKKSIEDKGGAKDDITKRWELFGKLLSNQVLPKDL